MTSVLIKEARAQRETERQSHENKGRCWHYVARSQKHQEPPETGRNKKESSQSLQHVYDPVDILISEFWLSKPRKEIFVLSATKFVLNV